MSNAMPGLTAASDLRGLILDVATDMFVQRGYADVSFGDISAATGTTRANIHHHFGNKLGLAHAALERTARDVTERYNQILTRPDTSLDIKLDACLAFNHERYQRYSPNDEGRPWSLITRFRLDSSLLDDPCRALLHEASRRIDTAVATALGIAIARGDLVADTPVDSLHRQLTTLLRYNQFVVTDGGRFASLELLYAAIATTIRRAYGKS